MPAVDLVVRSEVSTTLRARQVSAMFDVPAQEMSELRWKGDLPIEGGDWNVGLIVGPSGCGKSSVMRQVFGEPCELSWHSKSVIDDFNASASIQDIADVCQAVGFNTIPAWLRPFGVLSNGEQFRVDLARRLLELGDPIVVDEFSSVVDRQVAQIASHAVQKYVRRRKRRFVAVTCHYDVIDWLQPDWMLEPATMRFQRRLLQRRPAIDCVVARVPYSAWRMFAPFHYLTADLNPIARCFGLYANGQLAAFAGALHRPHPRADNIKGIARLVTLPDWQGLGLAMALVDALGAAYKAVGQRLHTYPAHPALIRSFDRSPRWRLEKRPGTFQTTDGSRTTLSGGAKNARSFGGRPCAVFEYCGAASEKGEAQRLIAAG